MLFQLYSHLHSFAFWPLGENVWCCLPWALNLHIIGVMSFLCMYYTSGLLSHCQSKIPRTQNLKEKLILDQFVEISVHHLLAPKEGGIAEGHHRKENSPWQDKQEAGSLSSVCPLIAYPGHQPIDWNHPPPTVGLLITHTQNYAKSISRIIQLSHFLPSTTHPWSSHLQKPNLWVYEALRGHVDTRQSMILLLQLPQSAGITSMHHCTHLLML